MKTLRRFGSLLGLLVALTVCFCLECMEQLAQMASKGHWPGTQDCSRRAAPRGAAKMMAGFNRAHAWSGALAGGGGPGDAPPAARALAMAARKLAQLTF